MLRLVAVAAQSATNCSKMTEQKQCFSKNLTISCASQRSVSQVCREIGINRPQFARYLKGDSLPSANNLLKIANFFQMAEADFFLPEELFRARFERQRRQLRDDPREVVLSAFRNQDAKLGDRAGLYHSYYISPSWGYGVVCSVIQVSIEQGFAVTRGILRSQSRPKRAAQKTRYHGVMSAARGHLFVVEKSSIGAGILCETIFDTKHQPDYADPRSLRGMTMSVSWRADERIFTSPIVWDPVDDRVGLRQAMRKCGVYASDSDQLPDRVRRYLARNR